MHLRQMVQVCMPMWLHKCLYCIRAYTVLHIVRYITMFAPLPVLLFFTYYYLVLNYTNLHTSLSLARVAQAYLAVL